MRGPLDGHRPADVLARLRDLGPGEPEVRQKVEGRRLVEFGADVELVAEEVVAEGPAVERELDLEGPAHRGLQLDDRVVGEALGAEGGGVDVRAADAGAGPPAS